MPKVPDYEKLGLLYLGREPETNTPLLYKNKNLTTHAAIIGMTGSGKTGLGIGIIEEAAIDKVPCIVIDPKGDMGNLLLTFPNLSKDEFLPWMDEQTAANKGVTKEELAEKSAQTWKEGLASWDQDASRIARLKESADFTIYTPGSTNGRSVDILGGLGLPDSSILEDFDTFGTIVSSMASSVLALIKEDADALTSKPHQLIANILATRWKEAREYGFAELIADIITPPFKNLGLFPLESAYPKSDRTELAMRLNGVMASPSFAAWLQGDALDIQKMLYSSEGKPKVAIFNIAHLSEGERMFFVSLLLGKVVSWMRQRPGSDTLNTLLYMDEIFGFFPPSANPPSKQPMMLLLKQARAHGLGVVLSTQNPVDLDYKGLSNIGTWFVGRLQTEQDRRKVADGIAAASSQMDEKRVMELLADLPGRRFLLKSVHLDEPMLFDTRWVLSYLKGPMSISDIKRLNQTNENVNGENLQKIASLGDTTTIAPILPQNINQRYLLPFGATPKRLKATLIATANLRVVDNRRNINSQQSKWSLVQDLARIDSNSWGNLSSGESPLEMCVNSAPDGVEYETLSSDFGDAKAIELLKKSFINYLYANAKITMYKSSALKVESEHDESREEFLARVAQNAALKRREELEALQMKYAKQEAKIRDRIEKAEYALEKERSDVSAKTTDTIISVGMTILGAFMGRKTLSSSTISRTASSVRKVGSIRKEKMDVEKASAIINQHESELESLLSELEMKSGEIEERWKVENLVIDEFAIAPKKSDITDVELTIVWDGSILN